jgi:hypothetical protein
VFNSHSGEGFGNLLKRTAAAWPVVVFGVFLLVFTSAPGAGDTNWYTSDVLHFVDARGEGNRFTLLEFGHLAWRPLGALLYPVSTAIPDSWAAHRQEKLAVTLGAVSALSGLLAGVVLFYLLRRSSAPPWTAVAVSCCFLGADASLTYLETGNAYVPGLLFVTLSLYCAVRATNGPAVNWRYALAAGAAEGIATLFWFPNILVMPAIGVTVLTWNTSNWRFRSWLGSERLRAVLACVSGFLLVSLAGYGIGMAALGIRSPDEFLAWYRSADHGWAQNRTYIRAVSGFARMLFDMSKEGILLKRLVLRDPYANAPAVVLALQGIGKLGLFYLSFAVTGLLCLRGKRQQEGGVVLFAAFVVLGAFALVFEPSTPSRFVVLLPFYFLALALVLIRRETSAWIRSVAVLGPVAAIALNTWAFALDNPCASPALVARFNGIQRTAARGDVAVAITSSDDLYYTADACRLCPSSVGVYQLVDPTNASAAKWGALFARKVLTTWSDAHHVWIPKRLLGPAPLASWNWVEGDNPAVSWRHFPLFFQALDTDRSEGGPDGFVRVARTQSTERLLTQIAAHREP